MAQLSEQELVRREKLSKLRELGIDPYPAELYPVTKSTKEIKSNFTEGEKDMFTIPKVNQIFHESKDSSYPTPFVLFRFVF